MEAHVEFEEEQEESYASPCLSGPPVPPSSTKHTPRKFSKEELSWKLRNSNARGWCETHRKQFMGLGQLDSDVQQTISNWFKLVDDDGSGALDSKELAAALKAARIPMDPGAVDEMIAMLDLDLDGEIEFKEIHNFLSNEVMAGKDPLGAQYMLPSGLPLPLGHMIATIRRQRMLQDVCKGGVGRLHWIRRGSEMISEVIALERKSAALRERLPDSVMKQLMFRGSMSPGRVKAAAEERRLQHASQERMKKDGTTCRWQSWGNYQSDISTVPPLTSAAVQLQPVVANPRWKRSPSAYTNRTPSRTRNNSPTPPSAGLPYPTFAGTPLLNTSTLQETTSSIRPQSLSHHPQVLHPHPHSHRTASTHHGSSGAVSDDPNSHSTHRSKRHSQGAADGPSPVNGRDGDNSSSSEDAEMTVTFRIPIASTFGPATSSRTPRHGTERKQPKRPAPKEVGATPPIDHPDPVNFMTRIVAHCEQGQQNQGQSHNSSHPRNIITAISLLDSKNRVSTPVPTISPTPISSANAHFPAPDAASSRQPSPKTGESRMESPNGPAIAILANFDAHHRTSIIYQADQFSPPFITTSLSVNQDLLSTMKPGLLVTSPATLHASPVPRLPLHLLALGPNPPPPLNPNRRTAASARAKLPSDHPPTPVPPMSLPLAAYVAASRSQGSTPSPSLRTVQSARYHSDQHPAARNSSPLSPKQAPTRPPTALMKANSLSREVPEEGIPDGGLNSNSGTEDEHAKEDTEGDKQEAEDDSTQQQADTGDETANQSSVSNLQDGGKESQLAQQVPDCSGELQLATAQVQDAVAVISSHHDDEEEDERGFTETEAERASQLSLTHMTSTIIPAAAEPARISAGGSGELLGSSSGGSVSNPTSIPAAAPFLHPRVPTAYQNYLTETAPELLSSEPSSASSRLLANQAQDPNAPLGTSDTRLAITPIPPLRLSLFNKIQGSNNAEFLYFPVKPQTLKLLQDARTPTPSELEIGNTSSAKLHSKGATSGTEEQQDGSTPEVSPIQSMPRSPTRSDNSRVQSAFSRSSLTQQGNLTGTGSLQVRQSLMSWTLTLGAPGGREGDPPTGETPIHSHAPHHASSSSDRFADGFESPRYLTYSPHFGSQTARPHYDPASFGAGQQRRLSAAAALTAAAALQKEHKVTGSWDAAMAYVATASAAALGTPGPACSWMSRTPRLRAYTPIGGPSVSASQLPQASAVTNAQSALSGVYALGVESGRQLLRPSTEPAEQTGAFPQHPHQVEGGERRRIRSQSASLRHGHRNLRTSLTPFVQSAAPWPELHSYGPLGPAPLCPWNLPLANMSFFESGSSPASTPVPYTLQPRATTTTPRPRPRQHQSSHQMVSTPISRQAGKPMSPYLCSADNFISTSAMSAVDRAAAALLLGPGSRQLLGSYRSVV